VTATPDLLTTLDTPFVIGGREFRSRLLVGTGKYASNAQMIGAIEASGAEVVTVAVRRVDLDRSKEEGILHHLDPQRFMLLANTAGCFSADDTIRYARLARAAGFNEWVKLEVIGDQETLLPDAAATIEATRVLAAEGFKVMAYTNDEPIGSGLGMLNEFAIRTIKHRLGVPVIVDAGVGTASDAAIVMEQGVDGVLMNTGIAAATDPVRMATAMRLAVDAGRLAYLAGRMPKREVAVPSSPTTGMLDR
jgi:thiazole synthase